ncbi:tetratricopeptide repeat protein [Thermobifida halotolerans]|uniref:Tetratricopeptide repeat protein n=1 Tax=Thermobifida halotolerans TaxID=483545 RepID=A0AA97M120_9ACTN|nr:tetratricopeptide repeat protein [Thermobifida halotolerans]
MTRNRNDRAIFGNRIAPLLTAAWRSVLRVVTPGGSADSLWAALGASPAERTAALEQALDECVEHWGDDHPHTITARNNLAGKYCEIGRRGAAITQFERALDDAVRVLGEHHAQTEVIRENLALCYEDAARFAEAAHHWEQLLSHRLAHLGEHDADTVLTRARLAEACRRVGRFDEAVTHYERVLDGKAEASAEETESWRIGMALALRETGRLDSCREQLWTVLVRRRRRLGARHPRTLTVHHQLGLAYARSGRHDDAARVLREVYRHCLAAAGDPDVRLLCLRVRRDLAAAYRAAGRPRDAAALY